MKYTGFMVNYNLVKLNFSVNLGAAIVIKEQSSKWKSNQYLKCKYDVPCPGPKGKSPPNPSLNFKLDFNESIDHPSFIKQFSFAT